MKPPALTSPGLNLSTWRSRSGRYTLANFQHDYPNDDICLFVIAYVRYGDLRSCPGCGIMNPLFYRVRDRKCFACGECGHQLHPLAGTIFHKSSTPLTKWFFAMFLFSQSRNGVAAKELQRHLGVTYKTAWRMARQIRLLMVEWVRLDGVVEADETYIGGRHSQDDGRDRKTPVLGVVERVGRVQAHAVERATTQTTLKFLDDSLAADATIYSDQSSLYYRVSQTRTHEAINHADGEYARGEVHTNTIEGFWGQLKRSLDGTYHTVSRQHLDLYVQEFVFWYNHRHEPIFPLLVALAAMPVR